MSRLTFESLTRLEFSVRGVRKRTLLFFRTYLPVSPAPFTEETVFIPLHVLASIVILVTPRPPWPL